MYSFTIYFSCVRERLKSRKFTYIVDHICKEVLPEINIDQLKHKVLTKNQMFIFAAFNIPEFIPET